MKWTMRAMGNIDACQMKKDGGKPAFHIPDRLLIGADRVSD
jgi:hypothetical protein